MYIGLSGLVILVLVNVMANWATWLFPRAVQRVGNALVNPVIRLLLGRHAPRAEYTPGRHLALLLAQREAAHLRGMEGACRQWLQGLPIEGLRPGRKPGGVVAGRTEGDGQEDADHTAPLHPGLVGHRRMGRTADAGADEAGPPAARRSERSSFTPSATASEGGQYYDSHTIENAQHPQTLLAYEMNYQPLNDVHGAPLRLRVENQLGFKMVKWIKAIEFAEGCEARLQGRGRLRRGQRVLRLDGRHLTCGRPCRGRWATRPYP